MHCLENIIYDTCDYCFYKKKFFKIRINKNMFKIDYVIKNDLVDQSYYISTEKDILLEFEQKNLINNFASQKNEKNKIYLKKKL